MSAGKKVVKITRKTTVGDLFDDFNDGGGYDFRDLIVAPHFLSSLVESQMDAASNAWELEHATGDQSETRMHFAAAAMFCKLAIDAIDRKVAK